MPRRLQRIPLELGLDLNINHLLRDGFIEPAHSTQLKDFHWLDADGKLRANAQIAADMTIGAAYGEMRIVGDWIDQTIQLVAKPRHFGGQQWYFVCPRRSHPVSVLWSLPGQRFFAGRRAWGKNVAYLSQYYAQGERAFYMAAKLCNRVGGLGASEGWEMPPKPKRMRWWTYERLCKLHETYCGEATTLPREYRLAGAVV